MFFTAQVNFYDETENRILKDDILIAAASFAEAASKLEEYYGNVLESFTIDIIEADRSFVVVAATTREAVEREGAN